MTLMIWVCESCGDTWHLARGMQPARDIDRRVLCESCRLYAAIPPAANPAQTVSVIGGVL